MGAFWNIIIPYKITVSTKPDSLQEFEKKFKPDFLFNSTRAYVAESPELPNGKRLQFPKEENTYQLSIDLLRKEFLPFYRILLEEWENLYDRKFRGKFPKQSDHFANKEEILQQIDAVIQTYNCMEEDIQEYLSDISDNYWVRDEGVPSMVVYEGYPLSDDEHSSICGLMLWSSYEKMHVYTQETLAFHQLVDIIKEKYSDSFILAKYIFVAGY